MPNPNTWRVLIPLNSGLVFVFGRSRAGPTTHVLIPLNSGLVFVSQGRGAMMRTLGLNPFEFRAGICFYASWKKHGQRVLIPLNSGLVFVYALKGGNCGPVGLNPFEFRAGICFLMDFAIV